jgi:glycosyltransferase involved in cell wall biosynthesis
LLTTAIIPAYNEGKTIGSVLSVLNGCHLVRQTIVVSDGSSDDTVEKALAFDGVTVVELLENRGKGGALKAGLEHAVGQVLLFLDADLIGLKREHLHALLEPVLDGSAHMTVGIFEGGRVATDLAQKMAPFLSGQRALKREILEDLSCWELSRFGVEMALHRLAEERGDSVLLVNLPDLSHVMKEEKMGLGRGLAARMKMYWEILCCAARIGQLIK